MRIFLETSVLLAASGSMSGASHQIFRRAGTNGWSLLASPYAIEELLRNLPNMVPSATATWARLRPDLVLVDDIVTLDRPSAFAAGKDRPILFSALASADVLLTLDRKDFGDLLDKLFYGLHVLKPGTFLEQERTAGRLS